MKETKQPNGQIAIVEDGPYLVSGNVPLSEQSIVTNGEAESLGMRGIRHTDYTSTRARLAEFGLRVED